jgi:catechol 2,3-dioxygenase-like lactoylglutathione lyase family enzyme
VSTLSLDTAGAHDARDFMPLHGIDHIELWVGNAAQAAYFFATAFGFEEVAYAGLETGLRDRVSHVLRQGRIRLVLTGTLGAGSEVAAHQRAHGDGVKFVALSVPDVDVAYREATARGALGLVAPHDLRDADGTVSPYAAISATRTTRGRSSRGSSRSITRATRRGSVSSPGSTTWSPTSSSARWSAGCGTTRRSSG